MKLSDYPSATSFLDEYIAVHTTMAELKLAQPPYAALMYVTGELTSYQDLRDFNLQAVQVHGIQLTPSPMMISVDLLETFETKNLQGPERQGKKGNKG
ncbi:hypothetical protein N7451_000154 [Penicillium sp. IBT 35674x]|nr:hypothetical protein N7451_000154 [Penicillium sp. IBT 35674x]